jgi:hypothetical protein
VSLGEKNRKVRNTGTRDTWKNHVVGPKNRLVDMHCLEKGVNTPLNSCISGIRGIRV